VYYAITTVEDTGVKALRFRIFGPKGFFLRNKVERDLQPGADTYGLERLSISHGP